MWWKIGAVVGALGVVMGAFGAHALTNFVEEERWLNAWTTGARYHQIHAVVLLVCALHPNSPRWAPRLFLLGIALFSGSLYLMAITQITALGAITPIGGLALIAGWFSLSASSIPRTD